MFDRIIIDSPPVEVVSDALVLSRLADGVVYFAESPDTSVRLINNVLEKLCGVGAPFDGVMLIQVNVEKLATYGSDYEIHGYYNCYGYSATANGEGLILDREELRRKHLGNPSKRSKPESVVKCSINCNDGPDRT